ncbi:MAG: 16S rRNA (cytosine(1402)-N(4))-methyltransferase RsmH [Acidobacteria bacterium]|nr:16S rRNA (cytosine(1402)-N(4))-methyltransferase RsmH [Acidobacteriota bacterium]
MALERLNRAATPRQFPGHGGREGAPQAPRHLQGRPGRLREGRGDRGVPPLPHLPGRPQRPPLPHAGVGGHRGPAGRHPLHQPRQAPLPGGHRLLRQRTGAGRAGALRDPPHPPGGCAPRGRGGDPGADGPPGHLESRRLRTAPGRGASQRRGPGAARGAGDLAVAEITAHVPVMLQEVVEQLQLPPEGRMLDLTLGLGGHAEAILARSGPGLRLLGVDRDPEARAAARARLGADARLTILADTYEDVWDHPAFEAWRALQAPEGLDGVLMDLGCSMLQLRDPKRGFSFREEGPLDMRMDPDQGPTALQWIAEQDATSLAAALFSYGQERASRPIARAILLAFQAGRLHSTRDLAEAVYTVIPREPAKRKGLSDPATRTFQAIRIAVNGELERLGEALRRAVAQLKPGGRIAVISFHSLEDRIVKRSFRHLAGIWDGPGRQPPEPLPRLLRLVHPGGIVPSEAELSANPASRSARLRVAERISETPEAS